MDARFYLLNDLYYIYILECINNALYTGYTTDIKRRYQEHLDQSYKCKYTRSFPPRRIAACWKVMGKVSLVLKIEKAIKSLTKKEKLNLIASPDLLSNVLLEKDQHKIAVFIEQTLA